MGEERARNELIQFIVEGWIFCYNFNFHLEMLDDDEDEVEVILAESLGQLLPFIGG